MVFPKSPQASSHRGRPPLHAPLILALAAALLSGACAAQSKVAETPYYKFAYPEYWKVNALAKGEGEPTEVVIGKYSETTITEGVGGVEDGIEALYETSQADIEVRVYAWANPPQDGDAPKLVVNLLADDPKLELRQHGLIPTQPPECGREFELKYKLGDRDATALNLLKQPGWRTILVGGIRNNMLLGVVARVPYEQDGGLYCHNLANMRVQLQNFLDAMSLAPAPPAGSSSPSATPPPEAPAPAEPPTPEETPPSPVGG